MTTSFARKALLGTVIAASMGIGYAIGAQPHMDRQYRPAAERRVQSSARRRRTRAATANARLGLIDQAIARSARRHRVRRQLTPIFD